MLTWNTPGQYPVTLKYHVIDKTYIVTYGEHSRSDLTYNEAAEEIGSCLMHAACCAGEFSEH